MTEEIHRPRVLDADKVLKDVASELESQLEVLGARDNRQTMGGPVPYIASHNAGQHDSFYSLPIAFITFS